jgi:hypothetical protein
LSHFIGTTRDWGGIIFFFTKHFSIPYLLDPHKSPVKQEEWEVWPSYYRSRKKNLWCTPIIQHSKDRRTAKPCHKRKRKEGGEGGREEERRKEGRAQAAKRASCPNAHESIQSRPLTDPTTSKDWAFPLVALLVCLFRDKGDFLENSQNGQTLICSHYPTLFNGLNANSKMCI